MRHGAQSCLTHRLRQSGLAGVDGGLAELLLAREANVFVDDRGFAAELRASLETALCAGARELRRSDWRRLPLLRRGLSWLAYQLVRLAIGIAGYGGAH